ncbi:hypothetical protein XENORESO_001076 [Xenotaenia resolanae]|uniref:Uncharacterized protein n=1 Tax=Xenotaenia resolanae TaxID=208358 RepID=A0ABV0W1C2_9TELE
MPHTPLPRIRSPSGLPTGKQRLFAPEDAHHKKKNGRGGEQNACPIRPPQWFIMSEDSIVLNIAIIHPPIPTLTVVGYIIDISTLEQSDIQSQPSGPLTTISRQGR